MVAKDSVAAQVENRLIFLHKKSFTLGCFFDVSSLSSCAWLSDTASINKINFISFIFEVKSQDYCLRTGNDLASTNNWTVQHRCLEIFRVREPDLYL